MIARDRLLDNEILSVLYLIKKNRYRIKMQNIDTLVHCKHLVPVEPAGTVYNDYSIAIDDGIIIDLLPITEANNKYTANTTTRLDTHIVLPGLVNIHGHAAMTLMRGIADDLPLMTWLQDHIWPAEAACVSADFVYDGSLHACAEMLLSGTTCFTDMYFFPEEVARAAETAHMRASVGLITINFPSAWAQNPDEYLSKGIRLHDQLRGHNLVKTSFAPHAPYTVSDEPLKKIITYAEELDIPIQMHIHETAFEIEESIKQTQQRPLQRLKEMGLLTPRLIAVHMTQLTDEEIAELAEYGVHVAHCPESNLKLASGFCPLQKLLNAGVNVGLGTDGAASNNDLDMFGEMRTAAMLAKGVAGDASAVSAEQALRMATINGARALGREDEIGSIEVGKAADITAVDINYIDSQPVFDPISHLVYVCGRQHVTDVWVAGKHVVKDAELTTVDRQDILNKATDWQHSIVTAIEKTN